MRQRIFDTLLNVTVGDQIQYPEKSLDRFLLICSEISFASAWISEYCVILKANAPSRQYIVRPIWDERDPFEIVIATRRAEVLGKIYYEVIDLLPKDLDLLVSPRPTALQKANHDKLGGLRSSAHAGRRVRHEKTTFTWPEPAHDKPWDPSLMGQPTPKPTIPDIVKEPRWPF